MTKSCTHAIYIHRVTNKTKYIDECFNWDNIRKYLILDQKKRAGPQIIINIHNAV